MKAGLTIEELATEVMRQKDAKADYIVNTSMLAMEYCGTELVLRVLDDSHVDRIEPLDIADTAHRQIGTRLGIPAKYYGKMLTEHPDLLATNVNAWFEREPTERMLRYSPLCFPLSVRYPMCNSSAATLRTAVCISRRLIRI